MDVKLPNLGEGADSGVVVAVLVKPGAPVKKGQNIIELETGKAVAPIPSPAEGTVGRIAVKEGDKLGVGQLILVLEGAASAAGTKETAPEVKTPKPKGAASATAAPPAPARVPVTPAVVPSAEATEELVEEIVNERPAAGPYVRRVARDLAIDLRYLRGSGKSGQIVVDDLRAYIARLRDLAARPRSVAVSAPGPASPVAAPARLAPIPIDFTQWGAVTRKPLSQMRKIIAERMVESSTSVPAVTQFDDADITELDALRQRHGAAYQAKGAKLTVTSFVIKAVSALLVKHPIFNASLDLVSAEVIFKRYVHLGLAVDTEAGLLVPVLRDADRKSLLEVSGDVQTLATRARERKVALADLQGGTFTISNQGGIGGRHFTPIVNLPEVAILGLGRSAWQPVVRDGQVVPRLILPLALSYDHRLIDGGAAARFVTELAAALAAFRDEDVKL